MDTSRFTGAKTSMVYVRFEDDRMPEQRLRFRAISREDAAPVEQNKQARLKALERKLETLLKEVHELRREGDPKKSIGPNQGSGWAPR